MSALAGTAALARLALRRDRVQLPVWILATTAATAATAASVGDLYGTEQERVAYATATSASVVARAFNGPLAGTSLGSVTLAESFTLLAVLVPLMSIFAVVRHTRQNEETGRAELLGSAVVGRHAALAAALVVVAGANVALAVLLVLTLVATGLPVAGSLLAGAAVGGAGVAFAGVAALAAQVVESARGANGLATATLGVAFLLRAVGDASGEVRSGVEATSAWPSWLSPLGWITLARPYEQARWPVLVLPALLVLVAVTAAGWLNAHRDLGTGLLAVRPGPATAGRALLGPLGLAWRLQRGVLLGWAVGVVVLGVAMGAVSDEVDDFAAGNAQMAELIAQLGGSGGLTDAYLAAMMGLFGLAVAGYAVQALLRMRAEETGGALEAVLATGVSRLRWMGSHIACAVGGTLALLVLAGASTGAGHGMVAGDLAGKVARMIGAALAQAPATLVLAGFAVAVVGLWPRWAAALSWAALAVCLMLGQIGELLGLPQAVLDVSPFTHVPPVPSADVTVSPLVALLAVGAALGAAGMGAFRRRDVVL